MPDMMPQQDQGQPQDQAQMGGSSKASELMMNVGKGLSTVAQAIGASGAPDEFKQAIASLVDQYQQIVEQVLGGGQGGGENKAVPMGSPEGQQQNPSMRS